MRTTFQMSLSSKVLAATTNNSDQRVMTAKNPEDWAGPVLQAAKFGQRCGSV